MRHQGLGDYIGFLFTFTVEPIFNEGTPRIGEKVEKDVKVRFIWAFSLKVYTYFISISRMRPRKKKTLKILRF